MIAFIDTAGLMATAAIASALITAWVCGARHRAIQRIEIPDPRPPRHAQEAAENRFPKHLPLPPLHLRERKDIEWCDPCKLWGIIRQHACVPPTTEELTRRRSWQGPAETPVPPRHAAQAAPDVSRETTVTFAQPLPPLPEHTQLMEIPEEDVLTGTIVEDPWDWSDVHPALMPSTESQVEQMLAAITRKAPARA